MKGYLDLKVKDKNKPPFKYYSSKLYSREKLSELLDYEKYYLFSVEISLNNGLAVVKEGYISFVNDDSKERIRYFNFSSSEGFDIFCNLIHKEYNGFSLHIVLSDLGLLDVGISQMRHHAMHSHQTEEHLDRREHLDKYSVFLGSKRLINEDNVKVTNLQESIRLYNPEVEGGELKYEIGGFNEHDRLNEFGYKYYPNDKLMYSNEYITVSYEQIDS